MDFFQRGHVLDDLCERRPKLSVTQTPFSIFLLTYLYYCCYAWNTTLKNSRHSAATLYCTEDRVLKAVSEVIECINQLYIMGYFPFKIYTCDFTDQKKSTYLILHYQKIFIYCNLKSYR